MGDRVGTRILDAIVRSAKQPVFLVASRQTPEFERLVKAANGIVQLISEINEKPNWSLIRSSLPVAQSLRGLSWFPHIFPPEILECFSGGILNIHNSYLPFNRGRHSTFWAIYDETPCGATIHWVDTGVDSGRIVERIMLENVGFANADMIYERQLDACVKLGFKYAPLLWGEIDSGIDQDPLVATHHYAREIEHITSLPSDGLTTWNEVVKLLRATATARGSLKICYPNGVTLTVSGKVLEDFL